MAELRIGMSGWTHDCWRNSFYPKGLARKEELSFASRKVTSIEVNGTFYGLQKPPTFQRWYDETPDNFVFGIKAPQFVTHVLRLKECEEPLSTFLASGVLCLKQKLGPILWQFPPYMMLKDDRFEEFAKILPHTAIEAAELAKNHGMILKDRSWTQAGGDFKMRHAFEFRHPSFMNPTFIAMLKNYGVSVVFADSGKTSPYCEDLTADFVYLRMHGYGAKLKKGYSPAFLKKLAGKIEVWMSGEQVKNAKTVIKGSTATAKERDVFVYFDNDETKTAPLDALKLLKLFPEKKYKKAA